MGVNSSPSQVSVRACHARCVLSIQVTTHVTWRESESECDSGCVARFGSRTRHATVSGLALAPVGGGRHAGRHALGAWVFRLRSWEHTRLYRLITTYRTYDEPTSRLEEPFMRLVKRSKCAMSMSSTMSSRHAERQASTGSLPPGLAPEISGAPCCTRGRSRCCMLGSV